LRFLRKHRVALLALLVYHIVFFFPTLFMARVVSPNDVFFNYDPWASTRSVDVQNSLMNDPATAYFPLISLVKGDWHAFHWDPFIASGISGFGSSSDAVLSPFVFFPALILPLAWVFTGIILLKLEAAFFFTYLWLREERLGKGAAAVGAILFAASGAIAVRWLWQTTNAAALYPALLWIASRTARGKRVPFVVLVLIALSYALAGFPAAMAYGAWIAAAYFVWLSTRQRLRIVPVTRTSAAVVLALVIAAPSIVPFAQILRRTGYLEARSNAAQIAFPLRDSILFVHPDALGNPADHNWNGDPALGSMNNYVESTVYLGLLVIPLALLALPNRRARERWFWFAAAGVLLACMFGFGPLQRAIGGLAGFKYSPMTRLQILLPIPAAYLSAAGTHWIARRWRLLIASLLVVAAAADLGVFAGRFYPYLPPAEAVPPVTPTIAFLQHQPKPFRIAPFFLYLWPNSAELFRLEDVRSHSLSGAAYRRLLQRIDASSLNGRFTLIDFNSLKFDFTDPLVPMLGIRYFIEDPQIDIIKWTTFKFTKPGVKELGPLLLRPGEVLQRHVVIDAQPFHAIEISGDIESTSGTNPHVLVTLKRGPSVVFARAFTPADIRVMNKMYVPVQAGAGEVLSLRVQSFGVRMHMLKGAVSDPADSPLFYGRVTVPVIFDRELPDGRIFLDPAEVPRFHSVTRLLSMTADQFLASRDIDFLHEAALTPDDESRAGGGVNPAAPLAAAQVSLTSYEDAEQTLDVRAAGPAFIASSEKLTPELRVSIDGRAVAPLRINMIFAGVPVPAGHHRVVFSRRIGRGWWGWSGAAMALCIALSIIDVWRRG